MNLDFPTIMVLLVVVSGVIWALDIAVLARRRRVAAAAVAGSGDQLAIIRALQPPVVVEYARSFFPVFLVVLVLRSFIAEPFRIPSNSMMPTLLTGDFILVNKFTYGIRIPVLGTKIISIGTPQRGDVVVFKYPRDPSIPYIKRVVGVPGDNVEYYNKNLYINGEQVEQEELGIFTGFGSGVGMTGMTEKTELLPGRPHAILVRDMPSGRRYQAEVAPGNYFVLGDNRDNSRDSRFWGTVPDELLIGKAFLTWMNWDWGFGIDWSRIGDAIH
ncbi:MAG: signal peptidase I [Thiotrichales bacterium]|nr:signal peptidase I [Thiotrichales bacterium]